MAVQNSVSNQALLTTSSPAFNNVIPANTSTATAGGTTTLTAASTYSQFFTGVLSQTVVFPNTSGLSINTAFLIVNNSTGSVTVNASDASLIVVLSPSSQAVITCISVSVTTNAAWNTQYALKTLAPSLNNIGLSYSGGDPSTISIMCNYSSGLLFNTFYPSLLVAQQQTFSVAGPDVMNFGNIQGFLSAFTYSQTGTTSASFPSLLYFSAAASITLPLATTFSMPNLMYCGGALTLNLNSLITLDLPALIFCNGSFGGTGTSLTTLNIPVLTTIFTTFTPTYAVLTSFTATSLATVTGNFAPVLASLTTLSLPALTTCGAAFSPVCASATTVTLTSLATITGVLAASFASLTTLSMPALVSVGTTFTINAVNLVTFSLGATLKRIGGNFTMSGMKLDQASVDGILVSLAALDGTNGTTAYSSKVIVIDGGTSSAPSATGLTASAILVGRGCTVITN